MKESLPFIVIAILVASLPALGQFKYDYTWAMGYDCCRGDENDNYLLDFTSGQLKVDTTTLQLDFFRSGQICDPQGKLLLYTDGCKLYNGDNQLVVNGDSLIQSDSMSFYYCFNYGRQGLILIPDSYNENRYWMLYKSLFARSYIVPKGGNLILYDAIRYALVDIHKNSGRGEVVEKSKVILRDTALVDGDIAAVRHVNNIDWWFVTTTDRVDFNYYILRLRRNGIDSILTQKIGNKIDKLGFESDGFLFSPDGSKLARFLYRDGLFLFDFDREHGVLSNFKKVDFPNSGSKFGGLAFSPSGRFLYVATDTILYQYDFWETDSTKAMVEVGWFDGYYERYYTTFYTMQLGPDCRIYMATNPNSRYLHVIKKPDLKGTACEFVQRAVRLPWYNDYYMPYYPNFRLGYAPVCDSTIGFLTNTEVLPKGSIYFKISPNPVRHELKIEMELQQSEPVLFMLEDLHGHVVMKRELKNEVITQALDVQELPAGVYVYTLSSKKEVLATGKVMKY